ncbi:MAG: hypothetical protein ACK2TU_07100 [Anaerolineales bacterium]
MKMVQVKVKKSGKDMGRLLQLIAIKQGQISETNGTTILAG